MFYKKIAEEEKRQLQFMQRSYKLEYKYVFTLYLA